MFSLPKLYLITPEPENDDTFLNQLQYCLNQGIKLVQFRSKTLSSQHYNILAIQMMQLCKASQAILMLNQDIVTLPQAGRHLSSAELMTTQTIQKKPWLSAACHNENELLHAQKIGIDFVTLSPVLLTATHPEVRPLGWHRFAELTKLVSMPVYALGGLKPTDLTLAQQHGAYGVAAIKALWKPPSQ